MIGSNAMMVRRAVLLGASGLILTGALARPTGAVDVGAYNPVLQIDLENASSGQARIEHWTLEALCDLPLDTVNTTTPWTDGPQEFEGVRVEVLLDRIGIESGDVILTASNDYSITTTADKLRRAGALLAFSRNGEFMRPRDKGPFWLVFDYDNAADLRTETIFALSVWQLDRLRISR